MRAFTVWFAAALVVLVRGTSPGAPADAAGATVGVRAIVHSVEDLDTTVKFYREALGLVPVGADGKPVTAMAAARVMDDALSKLTDTHGATFRNALFNVPGATFLFELIELKDTPRQKAVPRLQDPGVETLVLTVRDVNAALDAVKNNGGSVLSKGGEPLKVGGETSPRRSVIVRDPDGFLVELTGTQPSPESGAPGDGMVLGARVALTTKDIDQTMKFYHDVLGFETKPAPPAFATNKTIAALIGAEGAQWRLSAGNVPGVGLDFEFLEYKGVPRKSFTPRLADPGSPGLSLHVKDVESAMKAVAAGGGSIVTRGQQPVKFGPGTGVLVRDPNGVFIVLIP
jgi:catechol 2,3-dioxygenase-like lactoylglutathione lyase family enzyme